MAVLCGGIGFTYINSGGIMAVLCGGIGFKYVAMAVVCGGI